MPPLLLWLALLLRPCPGPAVPSPGGPPQCVSSAADIGVERPGRWVGGGYAHGGHFARAPDRARWLAEACPVQQRVFACYRHKELQSLAQTAEARHFQPAGCSFRPFHPLAFLKAIAGRNLFFCCDSVSQQFFEAVVCSLHGATPAKYRVHWWDMRGKFGPDACGLRRGKHCHLSAATVSYPAYNASVSVKGTYLEDGFLAGKPHGHNTPEEYFSQGGLATPQDVAVLNFGLHFTDPAVYRSLLADFFSKYAALPAAVRPALLWAETGPQHFNTSHAPRGPGVAVGQWVPGTTGPCVPYADMVEAHAADYHNRIAEELCQAHRVPILRVMEASKTEWRFHTGQQIRNGRRGGYDCTHFCQPSAVFFHWRELLRNALAVL
eukprot:EG_transcript_16039